MAQTPVTKTLTDLPVYADTGYAGHLLYTDSNIEYRLPINVIPTYAALMSPDGEKYLGKCQSIAQLRTIEPTISTQTITVERAVSGGPLINAICTYDPLDTTSPDNGFSIFVTPGGARWKTNSIHGHNVFMAGFDPQLNNLHACINKISQWYVSQAIADVQINNRKGIILVPTLSDTGTTYTITNTIFLPPSLVELRPLGDMIFDCSSITTTDAFVLSHEYVGLNSGLGNSKNGNSADAGGYVINPQGTLFIKGAGITSTTDSSGNITVTPNTTGVGIVFGNRTRTSGNGAYLNVRDAKVRNVRVWGFTGGLQFGNYDTYLCSVEDSNFYDNTHNHYQPNLPCVNSGEGLRLINVVLSNAVLNNVYINTNGHDYWYDKTHIDYARQDGISFGPNAVSEFILTDCWVEGNYRWVFGQPTKTGSSGQCRLLMQGGKIVPNRYGVTYRGVRPIFKSTVYNTFIVELMKVDLNGAYAGYMCNDAYGSWCGLGDQTTLTVDYRLSDTYKWLPNYKYGVGGYLINNLYTFTGVAGASLPTSISTATAESAYHWAYVQGGGSIVYGTTSDADSDGLVPIAITATATSDVAYLYCANYFQFPRNGMYVSAKCAVKCAAATDSVTVQAVLRPLTYPTITSTLNTTTNVITNVTAETSRGVVTGESVDVLNGILNKTYLTVLAGNYVSTPPLKVNNHYLGTLWGNVGLKFTGFTGTIYIKLPAYWFNTMPPN